MGGGTHVPELSHSLDVGLRGQESPRLPAVLIAAGKVETEEKRMPSGPRVSPPQRAPNHWVSFKVHPQVLLRAALQAEQPSSKEGKGSDYNGGTRQTTLTW